MRIIVREENTQSFTVPSDVTYLTEDGLDYLTETGDDLLIDVTSTGTSPLFKTAAEISYFRTSSDMTFTIQEFVDLAAEDGTLITDEAGTQIVADTGNNIITPAIISH